MLRRIRQWRRQFLVRYGAEQYEANLSLPTNCLDPIEELIHFAYELFQSRFSIERTGHSVPDKHNCRIEIGDLLPDAFQAFAGSLDIKTEPRSASRCVTAPTEIAEGHISVRELSGKYELDVPVGLFAFDECVA